MGLLKPRSLFFLCLPNYRRPLSLNATSTYRQGQAAVLLLRLDNNIIPESKSRESVFQWNICYSTHQCCSGKLNLKDVTSHGLVTFVLCDNHS